MSRIRSSDTEPEKAMKKILADLGCRFAMHPKMYGNPDFVLERNHIVIFCDGDFWHGYRYYEKKTPIRNTGGRR